MLANAVGQLRLPAGHCWPAPHQPEDPFAALQPENMTREPEPEPGPVMVHVPVRMVSLRSWRRLTLLARLPGTASTVMTLPLGAAASWRRRLLGCAVRAGQELLLAEPGELVGPGRVRRHVGVIWAVSVDSGQLEPGVLPISLAGSTTRKLWCCVRLLQCAPAAKGRVGTCRRKSWQLGAWSARRPL